MRDWSNPGRKFGQLRGLGKRRESRNANNVTGQILGLLKAEIWSRLTSACGPGGRKALREGKLSKIPTLLYTDEQSRVVMMRAQPMS